MPFKGPGIYEIVPYQKPTLNANSWGGGKDCGEPVRTYPRGSSPSDNALWQVALVTSGGIQDTYLIINVRTGCYLTMNGPNEVVTSQRKSPKDPAVLWHFYPRPHNNYDVWTINNVDEKYQLTVKDGSLEQGADIIAGEIKDEHWQRWYFDPR